MAIKPQLVVLLGYNAIGKSALGLRLADTFGGEIVSADSRQVYRYLDLGTAKVTHQERQAIPHHLIDVAEINRVFTLAEYQEKAFEAIDSIHGRGKLPFVVGGTGLYIWSIIDNPSIPPCPPHEGLRAELESKSNEELMKLLTNIDPDSANNPSLVANRRRITRALEVSMLTGRPFSNWRILGPRRYEALQIGLTLPFDKLYERIDRRVDVRFEQGMIEEVQGLIKMGATADWLHYLGLEYRWIARFLSGEIKSEKDLRDGLKHNIHQFARKQRTWFRKDTRIHWVEADSNAFAKATELITDFLER